MGSALSSSVGWFIRESTGKHPKYFGWAYPTWASTATVLAAVAAARWIARSDPDVLPAGSPETAYWGLASNWLLLYLGLLYTSRLWATGSLTLYEPMWQCNMAMLLAALACKWRSPRLLAASASTIAVDQMMWYIDVLGYILTRKWPVGAAAYLSWPETPFVKKLTAWHHIWFLPLCISLLRGLGSFSSATFAASCALNLVGIAASHALVPCALVDPRSGVETYMNINLGHECWKDVKFPMFHWFDRAPMYKIVPWVELNWNALNIPPFLLLKLLAR